jgi:hypothetical protein
LNVAGNAVALVLVVTARPLADEADLRACRRGGDQQQRGAEKELPHGVS